MVPSSPTTGVGAGEVPPRPHRSVSGRDRRAVGVVLRVAIAVGLAALAVVPPLGEPAMAQTGPSGATELPPDPAGLPPDAADLFGERTEAEAQAEAAKAELAALTAELETLRRRERVAAEAAGAATEAYVQARTASDAAAQAEAEAVAAVVALEEAVRRMAVEAYRGVDLAGKAVILTAEDLNDALNMGVYLRVKARRDDALLDELEQAREAQTALRREREAATREAEARAQEAASTVATLSAARAAHAALAEEAGVRLFFARVGLEAADAELAQLATALASVRAQVPVGRTDLVEVRGIWVHVTVAAALEAMLVAAQADGILLTGTGWRDAAEQVRLRVANGCPDIYTAGPGACRVPTALPGTSLHEQGLAVDFAHAGATITSRDDPAFVWLAANAERFGWRNLPSEPWHWSTTGE